MSGDHGTRIGSLFSGAGMLDVAALELFPGSRVAWHCEVDPAASKVLAHHWPDVPNLGDIQKIDWSDVAPVDIITGGFPCQDVSAAGHRRGLHAGTRSGLWSHMCAAIEVLRPEFVMIENVRGLLNARAVRDVEHGPDGLGDNDSEPVLRALGAVLGDLADVGYDAQWTSLRASTVGACHRRERVFILAHPADTDRARSQGRGESAGPQTSRASTDSGRQHLAGLSAPDDADTQGGRLERFDDRTSRAPERPGRQCDDARSVGSAHGPVAPLLPTPSVADGTGGHKSRSGARSGELFLPGLAQAAVSGDLLPTPRSSDGAKGGPNQRGSSGDLMLPSAVVRWGDYEAAILRQESWTRPAPAPTTLNARGQHRLSPAFSEWVMTWPAGWVSDPGIGLSRIDQLRIIGNGVVAPQAVAAFRYLRSLRSAA